MWRFYSKASVIVSASWKKTAPSSFRWSNREHRQFLKRIERTGYGDFLFFDWRRTPSGDTNPEFELNNPRYKGAQILIAGKNFACGSSREHAAWALNDFGFRAVIAPTFADIFFSNAGKNGIVLARLTEDEVAHLLHNAKTIPNYHLTVSLDAPTLTNNQGFSATFEVDPFPKFCPLEGPADIGLTLRHEAALDTFEAKHDQAGWLKAKAS